jgi:hypothetical protein
MDTSDCLPITTSVPEYGLIALDLQRSGSYEAAKAGIFPVIEVQGKKRVPVRAALRKLAGDDPDVLKAVAADFASKFLQLKPRLRNEKTSLWRGGFRFSDQQIQDQRQCK